MGFLFPAFLIGGLAIAIPIVLHFMRRDVAPEVPFSAVRLLRRSPIERSRRRRLRDLLLLAARVAALLLLAAAFARPYATGAAGSGGAVRIVAVDRSFSTGSPGRFAQALGLARQAIDEATLAERVALITFDDRAELLAKPGSAADARAVLAELRPGFGGTRYGPLLAKSAEAAAGSPARLIVVTDMQRSGWDDERRAKLPGNLQLEFRDIGPLPANVSVEEVRVETDRLVALVRNAGSSRQGRVRVLREGREVAAADYTAGADTVAAVAIAYRAPAAGSLAVSVDDTDGVPADNVRHLLLDAPSRSSVLIVTSVGAPRSGFYLARAIEAAGEGAGDRSATDVRIQPGAQAAARSSEALARHAVVVLLSTRGLDRQGRERLAAFVRGGGGLLVAAADDVEPDVLSTTFGWQPPLVARERAPRPATLAATDPRHPIFRPFGALAANLGQARFDRAWSVQAEGWDVAARFSDGSPALLERREGGGRVVLFTSDVDRHWNDFPLNAAFVPFVLETMRYVSGAAAAARAFTVGSAPAGVPQEPGIYTPAGAARPVSVNVDPRESAPARISAADFEAMVDRISLPASAGGGVGAHQVEARQSWWQYGLLLMLATLVVESFVGRA